MDLQTLTVDEVARIHQELVKEFASSTNPIFPAGVKSQSLLDSAVGRQHTSIGNTLKYPDPYSNAASLTFGICCDHPFHNGNKRTALVSMLAHLHKNRVALDGVGERELFNLVLQVATHEVPGAKRRSRHVPGRPATDAEVGAIARWLSQNSRSILKGERLITYRQLRQILEHFGFILKNPKGNTVDVYRIGEVPRVVFGHAEVQIRIGSIPFPSDNAIMSVKDIKYIRRLTGLTAEQGYDTETFYGQGEPIDAFIIRYRSILQRLASR